MTDRTPLSSLLEFAVDLAWRAGRSTLAHFQTDVAVEHKADGTPVTVADREAERLLRERIEARFPAHGIIGEEFGSQRPDAARRWILDPIDGTKSFLRGVPLYGVMVALEEDGEAVLGVLHFPALSGETVYAARGHGCWWDGRRARVSEVADLSRALLLTTDAELLPREGRAEAWDRLRSRAAFTRTWGDCYGHALVATGRAEAMLDPVLETWDAAALAPIVDEAGGRFRDWSGDAIHTGGNGISTNAVLAEEVHALVRGS
ncbi:MAG TPA: histidinol-phosphatase [Longimicrobiales bacterium]|nr:histidinol-phosphatase [Longimicrobiales bacterium]